MSYIFESISPADVAKIFAAAKHDERKTKYMQMRGGHFELGHSWVIDRAKDYFLFSAPKPDVRAPENYYYFHFKGRLIELRMDEFVQRHVVFFQDPSMKTEAFYEELKRELAQAFALHGFLGLGLAHEPPLTVSFED
jgi:hypothetical protein